MTMTELAKFLEEGSNLAKNIDKELTRLSELKEIPVEEVIKHAVSTVNPQLIKTANEVNARISAATADLRMAFNSISQLTITTKDK